MQNQRIKKAKKFLNSAKILLNNGDYDSCIPRCYYALFHASVALLEKFGIRQEKWEHKFVLSAFNREFVHRRKVFPPDLPRAIRDIFYERMDADYNAEEISYKKAQRVLDKAENIFHSIHRKLEDEKRQKA